jgi:hypothetical protein
LKESVKYLGIQIDRKLDWKDHITKVTSKLNQHLGVMKFAKKSLSQNALRTIYASLSHSAILYGIEVWGTATKTALNPIKIAQNKLLRTVVRAGRRETVIPIATQLRILPLEHEIRHRRLIAAYRIQSKNLQGVNINREHKHTYPTRFATNNNLPIPSIRTERYGNQGLLMAMINEFNCLPTELKALCPDKFGTFKRKIKEYIWMGLG